MEHRKVKDQEDIELQAPLSGSAPPPAGTNSSKKITWKANFELLPNRKNYFKGKTRILKIFNRSYNYSNNQFGSRFLQATIEEDGRTVHHMSSEQLAIKTAREWCEMLKHSKAHPHILILEGLVFNHDVAWVVFESKVTSTLKNIQPGLLSLKNRTYKPSPEVRNYIRQIALGIVQLELMGISNVRIDADSVFVAKMPDVVLKIGEVDMSQVPKGSLWVKLGGLIKELFPDIDDDNRVQTSEEIKALYVSLQNGSIASIDSLNEHPFMWKTVDERRGLLVFLTSEAKIHKRVELRINHTLQKVWTKKRRADNLKWVQKFRSNTSMKTPCDFLEFILIDFRHFDKVKYNYALENVDKFLLKTLPHYMLDIVEMSKLVKDLQGRTLWDAYKKDSGWSSSSALDD